MEKVKGQKNKRGVLAIGLFPIGVSTTLISLATVCKVAQPAPFAIPNSYISIQLAIS
jgi:hypothetical protein